MSEGRLGARTGLGFYTHGERDLADYRFEVYRRQLRLLEQLGAAPQPDAALRTPSCEATPRPTTPWPDGPPSTGG